MEESDNYFGMRKNTYFMLMHLSQFLGCIIPGLGFAVPIILWIIRKDMSPEVDKHGKYIANFLISWLIYAIVGVVLSFLLIGIPVLIALGILQIIFVIIAALKANDGEYWKYPLSITFFH